ncbi:hypothetical protein DN752_14420 [Echinicola strongylocentroti]|uniref:Uncharacterized protein n=1 Tax=Echinicola strongylocentroti TaxID=1795355 RepID=A0A2Z4IKJ3_9BACT|nr:hypothetical protein DN752_14420 [Echinicola strongylocentroti]
MSGKPFLFLSGQGLGITNHTIAPAYVYNIILKPMPFSQFGGVSIAPIRLCLQTKVKRLILKQFKVATDRLMPIPG